jgi:hypothetical protein
MFPSKNKKRKNRFEKNSIKTNIKKEPSEKAYL